MIPTQPQGKPLRFLSVCSGMEAASIAFEPLGWKAVGFCEIDSYASAVLATRFPNTPNYGDLTQHTQWPISNGDVDLIIGGPPCQAFSVAGLRRGLADPRGNLTLTYLGLVDRLRPEWVIYENVPGLLSVDGGRTFGTFLHALGQLGYGWAYRVLDAQHVGECRLHPHRRGWSAVPQRRRRIFVVARRGAGGWASAAEVLSLREGVQRHLAAGGKKRQGFAPDAGGGAEAGCWWDGGQVSQTLDAVLQKGQTMPEKNRFPAVLQPVKSHWEGSDIHPTLNQCHNIGSPGYSNQELFSQKGAGLVPIPIQDGRDIEKHQNGLGVGKPGDPAYTVDTTGSQAAGIPFRKAKRAQSTTDDESWVEGQQSNTLNNFDVGDSRVTGPLNVSPTVVSRFGTGGGNVPLVNPEAISFQPWNLCRQAGADPSTTTFPTLKCDAGDQAPHVAHPVVPLDGMNLLSRLGQCGETHSMQDFNPADPSFTLRRGGVQHGVLTPMAVRRLTPNECLRLQGFPDNWTNIPWKGKPEGQAPDGPQYKCAGNSFAVPVVRWIGTRIAAQP
jgi:DNA (cytosine-5)-methyltransferase 1